MIRRITKIFNKAKFLDLIIKEEADFINLPQVASAQSNAVKELMENGYVKIDKFFDRKTLEQIKNDIENIAVLDEANKMKPIRKTFRVSKVEDKFSVVNKYFTTNEFLNSIVSAYFNGKSQISTTIYQASFPPDESDKPRGFGSAGFHFDGYYKRLKAMLLLEDVTSENGPFIYLPKTHHLNTFNKLDKMKMHYLGTKPIDEDMPDNTYFSKKEVSDFRLNEICQEITGRAGDVIIFETRGIHKAGTLKCGNRKVLVNYYKPMNS